MQSSFCMYELWGAIWRWNTNNSSLIDINVDVSIHSPTLQIITRKNVAFILSGGHINSKQADVTSFLKKITEFIHFLATEKLDEVTLKIS